MVIGINAGSVVALKSGLSFYILNLIDGFARIDKQNRYIVFCKKSELSAFGQLPENFVIVPLAPHSNVLRLIWEQTVLPFMLCRSYRIETLFSPNYTCPVLKSGFLSVVAFHDSSFFSYGYLFTPQRRIFKHIIRISMRCADRVIAVSECTRKDIARQSPYGDKIRVVYNAAHPRFNDPVLSAEQKLAIRKKYGIADDYILFAGLFEPRKNIPRLIRAFASVKDKVSQDLVIAGGGGWQQQSIFDEAGRPELAGRVKLIGYVSNVDLPALYAEACLFVFPSIYEGFGIAALEAIACGTPALVSNNSSLPEVVGEAGVYVDPFSVDDIAKTLVMALTTPDLLIKLKSHCKGQSLKFSWDKSARETLDCLMSKEPL